MIPQLISSCLLIGILFSTLSYSYGETLDEIRSALNQMEDNSEKVSQLIKYSKDILNEHPSEAITLANEALSLSQKLRYKSGVVLSYSNLGLIYMNQDNYNKASENLQKAVNLKKQLVSSDASYNISIAKDLRLLGISNEKLNKNHIALQNYQDAVIYSAKAKNWSELAQAKNSVGEVQSKLGQYGKAYRSFTEALDFARKAENRPLILDVENNLANTKTLLKNNESTKMELEVFQEQLEDIQDSLEQVKVTQEVLVTQKELLEIEKSRKEAEIKMKEAELMAKDRELEVSEEKIARQEAEQRNYWVGGGAAILMLLLILLGQIRRSRARKRANEALSVEKKKSDDLLLNILPSKIAEELKVNNKVVSVRHKDVTILFTDFKGFTSIASKLEPEQLLNKLEEAFNEFDKIIEEFGLEKIKTIGDAYMAVAGLPDPDPYHAIHAVGAAMKMQEYMDRTIGRQKRRGEEVWELRVGINSGPVVAGVIGKKKFAYDIWGDSVNLASRMETSGEAGKINISANTYHLVRSYVEVEPRRTVTVKNKGAVDMYFVKDLKRELPPYRKGRQMAGRRPTGRRR
ncbi:MAG: adenylate/guanylate cyclase domain-containing protein [Bacteroidota bacterium]